MARQTPYGMVDDLGVHPVPPPTKPGEFPDEITVYPDELQLQEEPSDDDKLYSIFSAAADAPDNLTKAMAVSERTGLPAHIVVESVAAWEKKLRQADNDVTKFREQNPVLTSMILNKPELAAAVLKDQGKLESLEQSFANDAPVQGDPDMSFKDYMGWLTFKGAGEAGEATTLKARSGKLQSELEAIAIKEYRAATGDGPAPTAEETQRANEIEMEMQLLKAITPETGLLAGMPGAIMEQIPRYLRNLGEIGAYVSGGAIAGTAAGGLAGTAVFPVVGTVAGGAAGFLAGSSAGLTGGIYKVSQEAEAALFYRDLMRKGTDPQTAYTVAQWTGVINGLAEAAPTEKIFGIAKSARALIRKEGPQTLLDMLRQREVAAVFQRHAIGVGQSMTMEGATEITQELVPIIAESRYVEGKDWEGSLAAAWNDLNKPYAESQSKQAFVGGMQAGGGMHVASPFNVVGAVSDLSAAREAAKINAKWEARAEAVMGSEVFTALKGQSAEIAKEFMARYGGAREVALPVAKLTEFFKAEGMSKEDVAKILPDVARQMESDDAEAEVLIKTTDFVTHVLPRTGSKTLLPDLREGDRPTAAEAPEVEKRAAKILEEVAKYEEQIIASNEQLTALAKEREEARAAVEAHEAKNPEVYGDKARQGREQEIKAYEEKRGELAMKLTALEDKIKKLRDVVEAGKRKDEGRQVFEHIRNRLRAINAPRSTATNIAALWQAFVETRAQRLGVKVSDYFKGLNLTFDRGEFADLPKKEQAKVLTQATSAVQIAKVDDGSDWGGASYDLAHPEAPLRLSLHEINDDMLGVSFLDLGVDENADNLAKWGGKGYATALYLAGLRLAQENGRGFVSDSFRSDATEAMYARLKKLGIKFDYTDEGSGRFVIEKDTLAQVDLDEMEREMEAAAEIQKLRGEKPSALVRLDMQKDQVATDEETSFQTAGKSVRGFFRTTQARDFFKITLTGKANFSTFVHETGHAFMAILERDALTHAESAADLAAIKEWLGASKRVTKDQYEQFARGFEGYMWEGKAPSEKLAGVFSQIMGFMRKIYATLRRLNAPLTPEVRNVMDRLLATDIEIQMAREKLGVVPLADESGVFTPEEYAAYRAPFDAAFAAVKAKADRKALSAHAATVGKKREKIAKEVEIAARANKDLNAREIFMSGKRLDGEAIDPVLMMDGSTPKRLDRDWAKENGVSPATLKALKKITASGGLDPDLAAMLLGYENGKELLEKIAAMPSPEAWVAQEIDRRMEEEIPGYRNNKAWQEENATRVLHSAEIGNSIWAGMVAMSKKLGGRLGKSAQQAIRLAAERKASEMKVLEMRPGTIARAEARHAHAAAEAWRKGDVRAALDAGRLQLFYHYLWRNVDQARDEVKSIAEDFKSFKDTDKRTKLARGDDRFLKAIDAILATVDYGQDMETTVSLQEIMQALRAEGLPIVLPATFSDKVRDFDSMSLAELRAVHESIENLAHLGREATKAFLDGTKATFNEAVTTLAQHIRANSGLALPEADPGVKDGNLYGWRKFKAKYIDTSYWHLKKIEYMMRVLDGGKTAGLMHQYVFQPVADAEAAEHALFREVFTKLREEFKRMPLKERFRHDKKVIFLGNERFSHRDMMAIALNMRNEGNMDRLMRQKGWGRDEIIQRLSEVLTAEDVELVNRIGDLVESLWPRVVEVFKRQYGIEPQRVTGNDVVLPGKGTIKGGYYPIIRDPRQQRTKPDPRAGDLWDEGFVSLLVGHSFTETRADNADTPLLLELDAVPHHLMKVIHYVTHYEATRKVDRLLRDPAIEKAVKDTLSHEAYAELRPWLSNIVHGVDTGAEITTGWDALLRWGRVGAGLTLMAGRLSTAVVQGLGLTMSAKELSADEKGIQHVFSGDAAKYIGLGAWEFAKDFGEWITGRGPSPFKAIEAENSSWILHRENYDRDLRLEYRRLTSAFSELGHASYRAAEFSMILFNLFQGTVNAITWHAALRKAQDEGHARPQDYANSVIRMSQSSGGAKDLAAIQRGPEYKKIFTVLYSFANVMFNAGTEERPGATGTQRLQHKLAQAWWVILMPAVLLTLIRGDDEELRDPEAFFKAAALESFLSGARSMPLFGDAARAAVGWEAKQAPWIDLPMRAIKGTSGIAQGKEPNDVDVQNIVNAIGVATHLPAGAAYNAVQYLDNMSRMQEPFANLLRPKRSQR